MRETGSLYQLQYLQMGTKTLVDLLNAEQELHQVRFDLVNREHDLRRLQVECLVNSGTARAAFGLEGTVVKGAIL
jgi:adhesin transport system outer membrane protein